MTLGSERIVSVEHGDGWCILSSHVPKTLPVWVPVPDRMAIVGLRGGYAIPGFTTREAALAAGDGEPRRTDLGSLEKEGRRNGIAINPGLRWEGGIADPMHELPREFRLIPQPRKPQRTPPLLELFPESSLFFLVAENGGAQLLRMPPGTDLVTASQRILDDIGEFPFAPIVLVDSGREPPSVTRALRSAAETT